uniref:Uncharacterized protein n=1 Tax=Plectus sambesii TaxID=2011161 RepID=A0A914VA79_9BILA
MRRLTGAFRTKSAHRPRLIANICTPPTNNAAVSAATFRSSYDLSAQDDDASIISVGLNRVQRRLHFLDDRKQLQQQGSPSDDDICSETRRTLEFECQQRSSPPQSVSRLSGAKAAYTKWSNGQRNFEPTAVIVHRTSAKR